MDYLKETDHLLAFHHPNPAYPFHVLLVPKRKIASLEDLKDEDLTFLVEVFNNVQELVQSHDLERKRVPIGGEWRQEPGIRYPSFSSDFRQGDRQQKLMDSIAVIDFGSQTTQLIVRRVREAHVYCEMFPWDANIDKVMSIQPIGIHPFRRAVFHLLRQGAPHIQDFILASGLPSPWNLLWNAGTHPGFGWKCGSG